MRNTTPRRFVTLGVVLVLAVMVALVSPLTAQAQDGPITFNEPEIISLQPGATVRLTFEVLHPAG